MPYSDEIRTVGSVTGPGIQTLLHIPRAEILEVTLQPEAGTILQLFEGEGFVMSGAWALSAGEIWSAPGKIVQGNLSVSIAGATAVAFEVRWRPNNG
jgi:hypothetical protein